MPDIMMCNAEQCDLSATCYRHPDSGTNPDPYRQSWWYRQDDSPVGKECPQHWKTTPLVRAAHDGSTP
jgi:hypothetical protein